MKLRRGSLWVLIFSRRLFWSRSLRELLHLSACYMFIAVPEAAPVIVGLNRS
jgi:hypothetical protein